MQEPVITTAAQVRGYARLAFDAVAGVAGIVESVHANIADVPRLQHPLAASARGITGLVYNSIQMINGAVRSGLDLALAPLAQLPEERTLTPAEETALAITNGVLGDHLHGSGNVLSLPMRVRRHGRALTLERDALWSALPSASGHLVVQLHGLCMHDGQWTHEGYSHGQLVESQTGATVVDLHYNSGRHVSINGRQFAAVMQRLVEAWPVPLTQISFLAHSMGGLVARSACHYADAEALPWRALLKRIVFLGTPHHGAPLERGGNRLQRLVGGAPYAAPLARLGMLRSAGVTDLRHGSLLDEDWQDRDRFAPGDDPRRHVPLPAGVDCYCAAVTLGLAGGDLKDRLLGDGLVPLDSALGRHAEASRTLEFAEPRRWIGYSMNHWDLLRRPELGQQICAWLQ